MHIEFWYENLNERDLLVFERIILKWVLELGFGESRQKYLSHKCFIFSRPLIAVYLVYSFIEDFYETEFPCQFAGPWSLAVTIYDTLCVCSVFRLIQLDHLIIPKYSGSDCTVSSVFRQFTEHDTRKLINAFVKKLAVYFYKLHRSTCIVSTSK